MFCCSMTIVALGKDITKYNDDFCFERRKRLVLVFNLLHIHTT